MTEPVGSAVARPADALWSFATAVYASPGVTSACLTLQDRDGVDVCLLLAALWAGRRGHRVDRSARSHLQMVAGSWNTAVVAPVRSARRQLRRAPHLLEGSSLRAAAEDAAHRLAEIELSAERSQLAELAEAIDAMPAARPSMARARRLARRVAGCHDRPLLKVIIHAAFP